LGMRVTVDDRSEKTGYKIRSAQMEKIPYMLVAGDKEAEEGTLSVRKRGFGDQGAMTIDEFIAMATKDVEDKAIW
ncbi:MAG: threonine--tRNA ligase, partial [Clostridia bacterium]|nr:threonine--tRNA ligase [Clostridia bacterium]